MVRFIPTRFPDAWLLEPEQHKDERGFFARTWCSKDFASHGCVPNFVQSSVSFNHHRGTLRGMHFQADPHGEAKLVRCTRGAIYDVIVDVRESSATFGHWQGFNLTADSYRAIYVPEGFAHGFQTLESDSEVLYEISAFYHPESVRGFHHADPAVGIQWPRDTEAVSARDLGLPPLNTLLMNDFGKPHAR